MSRVLSELLGANEPMFTQMVRRLEQVSGHQSIDVSLSSEILQKSKGKMRELGLDPKDTTGRELYESLTDLAEKHDQFLANAIGIKDHEDVSQIIPSVIKTVNKLPLRRKIWVMKKSVVRKKLEIMPPKKVMKHLGYRSLTSMIKRENVTEILGAAKFLESDTWHKKFIKSYSDVQPGDFETRDVEIIALSSKKYGAAAHNFVKSRGRNLSYLRELGAIIVQPMPVERMQGYTITILPLILFYVNELRHYSSLFKFNQVRPEFSHLLVNTLLNDASDSVRIAGQPIHWKVVQRHFGRNQSAERSEVFEPYIQSEDFEWRLAEDIIYRIEPALKFWEGMDYIGFKDGSEIVSFNLVDNAINFCNHRAYGQQSNTHFRNSLWSELWVRYIGNNQLEPEILKQLDNYPTK